MVVVDLSEKEFQLIKKIRNKVKLNDKPDLFDMPGDLQKEIDRQKQNIKNIMNLKELKMKPFDLTKLKFKKNKNNYYKKVEKTERVGSDIYKVTYEDKGDGEGIVETDRKLLKENVPESTSSFSSYSNSNSYSRMQKLIDVNGEKFRVTYEDKGDGKGMVETNRVKLSPNNLNLLSKNRSRRSNRRSNRRSRSVSRSGSRSNKRINSRKRRI